MYVCNLDRFSGGNGELGDIEELFPVIALQGAVLIRPKFVSTSLFN